MPQKDRPPSPEAGKDLRGPADVSAAHGLGRKWSSEELNLLKRLAGEKHRASAIAVTLGRTEAAVRGKALCSGIRLVSNRRPQPVSLRLARGSSPTDVSA